MGFRLISRVCFTFFLIIHIQLTKFVSYCPLAFQVSTLLSFQPSSHLVFQPSIFLPSSQLVFQSTGILALQPSSCLLTFLVTQAFFFFYSSISLPSRVLLLASLFRFQLCRSNLTFNVNSICRSNTHFERNDVLRCMHIVGEDIHPSLFIQMKLK